MTQPTMTVEQSEILARATEMESAIADPPSIPPNAPCGLEPAVRAGQQLVLSAQNMRDYLMAGATERGRLATSMRNAAKAYGAVDEEAAQTMTNGGGISSENIGDSGSKVEGLQDTGTMGATPAGYMDVKAAAAKIAEPDQAAAMANFADAWTDYNITLQQALNRFRSFQNWSGDAAAAVQASMDQQREWLLFMAKLSVSMAQQAAHMATLHRWAVQSHPTLPDVTYIEDKYLNATDESTRTEYMNLYVQAQQKSEDVQDQYKGKSLLDPVTPPKPPAAVTVDPPPAPQQQGLIPQQLINAATGGGQQGGMPQMPSMPSAGGAGGGGTPAGAGATLTGAGHEAPKLPAGAGGSMKPMSVGGLGGGGAAPASPMAPAIDVDSVRPAAAGDPGALGRGGAPAGAAAGGGGGGMPMGGHGAGGGGSKTKGAQQDDEALYTEDRAWTEAVIGNRRSQGNKEGK
jgi:ESX-1 secreted protein B PE domain